MQKWPSPADFKPRLPVRDRVGNIVPGAFTPVLAKHSKNFSLVDAVSIGVDRMQRNFEPLAGHIELVRQTPLTDAAAKLIIYEAFVEGLLEVPRHLARAVHENYFRPTHDDFAPRTAWSLSNAFTSAFKELDAVPQFRATAKLGTFMTRTMPQ